MGESFKCIFLFKIPLRFLHSCEPSGPEQINDPKNCAPELFPSLQAQSELNGNDRHQWKGIKKRFGSIGCIFNQKKIIHLFSSRLDPLRNQLFLFFFPSFRRIHQYQVLLSFAAGFDGRSLQPGHTPTAELS